MHSLTIFERRILPFLSIALLILVPAAACGGDSSSARPSPQIEYRTPLAPSSNPNGPAIASPAAQSTSQASTGQGLGNVTIVAKDTKFSIDKITVPAGSKVTVQMTNEDNLMHNIAFYAKKGDSNAFFTADLFKGPAVSKTFNFTAPATPGTYWFQCDAHPDQMNGQFIVN